MASTAKYCLLLAGLLTLSLDGVDGKNPSHLRIAIAAAHPYSHWLGLHRMAEHLIRHGHQVLYVNSDLQPQVLQRLGVPKKRIISYKSPFRHEDLASALSDRSGSLQSVGNSLDKYAAVGLAMLQDSTVHSALQEFKPDVVIADLYFSAAAALADKLGVPKVLFGSAGVSPPLTTGLIGNPSYPLLVPQMPDYIHTPLGLGASIANTIKWAISRLVIDFYIVPIMTRPWIQNDIAPWSMVKSTLAAPAVILNADFAVSVPLPLSPHIHAVGALNSAPAQALPADLERLFQASLPYGVVYVSMGSVAIPEAAELHAIEAATAAFGNHTIIWKLSKADRLLLGDQKLDTGNHVHIVDFVPQNDVLGHPATRLFVSHGGLNSVHEAAYHGVPLVGMPLSGDQAYNVYAAVDRGVGLAVSTKDSAHLAADLQQAIGKVLNNAQYKQRSEALSTIMQARRFSPAELAADVVERVGWTGGSRHMQVHEHLPQWRSTETALAIATAATVGLSTIAVVAALGYCTFLTIKLVIRKGRTEYNDKKVQ